MTSHVDSFLNCGDALVRLFRAMLSRAGEVGHRTVWARTDLSNDVSETKVFMFCTTSEETANKVHAVLGQAGLLCDFDLGDPNLGPTPPGLEGHDKQG